MPAGHEDEPSLSSLKYGVHRRLRQRGIRAPPGGTKRLPVSEVAYSRPGGRGSGGPRWAVRDSPVPCRRNNSSTGTEESSAARATRSPACTKCRSSPSKIATSTRSEEHTSELQSPYDLVCRLLLEK